MKLTACIETHTLKEPFRIARGVKMAAEVVVVTIKDDPHCGRGEAVPYARYGETPASTLAQVMTVQQQIEQGIGRDQMHHLLPAGAARAALDCALWDLEAQQSRSPLLVAQGSAPFTTAMTISLDTPAAMATAAARYQHYDLLKVKLDQHNIAERLHAVRTMAPKPRLIVDPNESWSITTLAEAQEMLRAYNVDLVEQPLPAQEDCALLGFKRVVPLCADESCHTRADLPGLKGKYDAVNIKLEKTGGLTEALALKAEAQAMGFMLMVGCMVSTSLAIAPALMLAQDAAFLDLDGFVWIKHDREGGLTFQDGVIGVPSKPLWGGHG